MTLDNKAEVPCCYLAVECIDPRFARLRKKTTERRMRRGPLKRLNTRLTSTLLKRYPNQAEVFNPMVEVSMQGGTLVCQQISYLRGESEDNLTIGAANFESARESANDTRAR